MDGLNSCTPREHLSMSETAGVITRSPADVVRMVAAGAALLAVLLIERLFGNTLIGFGSELLRGLAALPQWMVEVVLVGIRLLGVVVLAGGLLWNVYRHRWAMFSRVVAAGLLAGAFGALLDAVVDDDTGAAPIAISFEVPILGRSDVPSAIGIGVLAAVLTAAAPWSSRRWRRAGWALLVALMLARFAVEPVSFDSLRAAIVGWLCGAAVLVVGGAPSRRPTAESVIAGLASVGLAMDQLDRAGVDARGSTPYFGVAADGERFFIKVLGDDERSADILFRLYRRITPRDFGDERPFSTLRRAVEHEAFVALAARDLGVRTPRLRAFTTADPNGYVVAYTAIEGSSLDGLEADEMTDEVLAACWHLVGQLRRHRIAHRDLRLANIFLDREGEVWLIDFGFSEMAAADRLLATDVAELVASSSVPVGPERAVAHAVANVDPATLGQALDRLQLWALSGATRTALKARPGQLDQLRRLLLGAVVHSGSGVET